MKYYAVTHIDLYTLVMITDFVEARDKIEAVEKAGYRQLIRNNTFTMIDVRCEAREQESMIEVKEVPNRESTFKNAEHYRRFR